MMERLTKDRKFNLGNFKETILDLLFPKDIYCVVCGAVIDRGDTNSLCASCLSEAFWIGGETNHDEAHTFRNGYVCASYVGQIKEMVHRMKYREEGYIARSIGGIMADRFMLLADAETGELPAYDLLLPIPMHKEKKSRRGYDQAEQIALSLGDKLGIPVSAKLLARVRNTAVMSKLDRNERLHNLQGAFEIVAEDAAALQGKSVLMVDDVFTTGSSADACAEVLLAGGAETVDLIVFAHA
jgi:ComF family protein